jgi:ABC-type glycerol-3-phosphate transport system permease component
MAGLTLVLVPVILVYLFTQRYLIDGISAGAIK